MLVNLKKIKCAYHLMKISFRRAQFNSALSDFKSKTSQQDDSHFVMHQEMIEHGIKLGNSLPLYCDSLHYFGFQD